MRRKKIHELFEVYMHYCQYSRKLRPETLRGYREAFRTLTSLMSCIVYLEDATTNNLNYFFKKLETRKRRVGKGTVKVGVKASTIRTYWNKLNTFFVWLESNGHIDIGKNPLSAIRPPYPKYEDPKSLSKSEVSRIYGAVDRNATSILMSKRDKTIVDILFYCGLRKGELAGLEVRDIDLEKGLLSVRKETSKSGKGRKLPMHPVLEMHLRDYVLERNRQNYKTEFLLVSNNNDRGLTKHGLKHLVKRLIEMSGVKFHLHRFRHTFANNLARNDVGIIKMQRLMGHADPRMTQRYLRSLNAEDLRDDINRLDIDRM